MPFQLMSVASFFFTILYKIKIEDFHIRAVWRLKTFVITNQAPCRCCPLATGTQAYPIRHTKVTRRSFFIAEHVPGLSTGPVIGYVKAVGSVDVITSLPLARLR